MAAHAAVKGVANYYCGSLSENEYYSCSFIDRRHYPHTYEHEVPEGTPVGSEAAISAAIDAAAASIPEAIAARSKDGEAYLIGAAPSQPVLTAAGLGVPVTANVSAVIGGGGETAVAACCSVLVSNYRTIAIVEAHAAAHRRWGEDITKSSGCSVVMVDGACYDVNLRFPKGDDRTLSVDLVRRVAEVIVVPHMVLTDFPRPNSPCQVIVEDWSGYSRIVSIHPLHFVSKVIGGCGPMGGEMRIAFLDPVQIRDVLKTIQGMRLNTAPSVNLPAEDVLLTQPTTQLLAAMHPMTHLRRMPAYEFFGGWEDGDSPHSEEDFGWSVHDERREMLRWLTIYNPETVSAPDDPAQYHAYAAAGAGCDLRPWFRLSCLHPSSSDTPGVLSTTTPLIAGYGPTATYPLRVCVPAAATDAFLIDACFPARSRQRIPAVSYVNLRTGAVLCRSSQPLKGRSTAIASDEELCRYMVNHYTTYNSGHRNTAGIGGPAPAITSPGSPSGSSFSPPPSIVNRPAPPPSLTSGSTPARKQADDQSSPHKVGGSVVTSVISTGPQTLSIVDCRPRAAAMANDTVGGGYERHDLGRVKFFGIDNIHAVTGSYAKLRQLLVAHAGMMAVAGGVGGMSGALVAYPRKDISARQLHVLHAGGVAHSAGGSSDFHRGFWAETAWMVHIQRVLICALETAEYIERGESALVHCTDGWDRTSQTTALAMILMDPFFRTVRGFALLIEKEFAQFGHKFAERFGHMTPRHMDTTYTSTSGVRSSDTEGGAAADATPASSKQQPSPVFMQFLDALYQIIRQFPSAFEFTPQLLIFVAEHCSSCLYGTFLCNNAKERLFEGVTVATHSIWSDILTACDLERRGLSTPHLLEPSYDSERAMWFIQKRPKYPAPPTTPPTSPSPSGSTSIGSPDWSLARAPSHDGTLDHTHNNCGIDFLRPNLSSKRLAFWEEFYLRHDPDRALLPGASTTDKSSYRVCAVVTEGHTPASLQQAMIALPLSVVSPTGSMVTSRCRNQLVFPSARLSRGASSVYSPRGCVGAAPMYTTVSAPTEQHASPSTNPIVLQITTVDVCGIAQRVRKHVDDANLIPLTSGPMFGDAFMTWNDVELQAMKTHRKQDVREIFKVHQLAHWHRNGGVASMDQVSALRCRLGGNHPFLLTDSDLIALPAPSNVKFLGASDQGGVEQPEGGFADPAAIQHKLKRCSQCTAAFGGALTPWLSSRHYCDSCARGSTLAGLPLCGKCIKTTKDGRTLCINCFAIEA